MTFRLSIFVLSVGLVSAVDLPPEVTRCHRSDPYLGDCLQRAITEAVEAFKEGYPDLNIRVLEPFVVPEMVLVQSKTTENLHLSLSFQDLHIRGITKAQFSDFRGGIARSNPNQFIISGHVVFPELLFDGKYIMAGKLLLFTLDGNDKVHMEMMGIKGNLTMILEPESTVREDGETYLQVVDAGFAISYPEKLHLRYDNLIKGNPQLTNDMNRILEDSATGLQEIFKPSIERFFTNMFSKAGTKVFSKIPMDVVLPP